MTQLAKVFRGFVVTVLVCLTLIFASGTAIAGKTEVNSLVGQEKRVEFRGLIDTRVHYCISTAFPTVKINRRNLVSKIQNMLEQWNEYGAVNYTYVVFEDGSCTEQNKNVNLRFLYRQWSQEVEGKAILPWEGKPQVLWLNSASENFDFILGHELGHILGLRHENAGTPQKNRRCEENDTLLIEEVTDFDENSIMFWPMCRPANTEYYPLTPSKLDKVTIGCMYGFKTKELEIKYKDNCKRLNKKIF